jgi:hypothetical protein
LKDCSRINASINANEGPSTICNLVTNTEGERECVVTREGTKEGREEVAFYINVLLEKKGFIMRLFRSPWLVIHELLTLLEDGKWWKFRCCLT